MRSFILTLALLAAPAAAQETATASGGVFRVLDKTTGAIVDVELANGDSRRVGHLTIYLGECRFPAANASGDAFEWLTILYQDEPDPVFQGWMIASAPALNAMDHPRYDVWALRCTSA
ncbi:DUF2155 domain-containing protein [Wenxinia marina]|uniref:DUF2155 domain-containing protein n=1 Tax=Wenxinia marina DSM 24838 TaxID=1123501 RepID=A0A0D0PBL1_9RHOB|nr:DUF2155 domain-containing protein [Wenxinia marina]KIQ68826.1 Uncharacterized protein Wenmar_02554 [Wenxinia marina DSM 24838]GGL64943.1 hypothetical protein GCM10011392_19450 [Wenxinia marina]